MFAGISFFTLVLVIFLFFWFRKPIKLTTQAMENSLANDLPELIAAASDAAVNSATSAAFNHRAEIDAQLQEDHGVSLEDVRALYEAMAQGNKKPNRKSKQNP